MDGAAYDIAEGGDTMGVKTKIDWCDSTWNPVTGCLHGCAYCYARKIAERFKGCDAGSTYGSYCQATWRRVNPGSDRDKAIFEIDAKCPPIKLQFDPTKQVMRTPKAPYPWGFQPTLHRNLLDIPMHWKKPRTIFVCSMADLFGDWVPDAWIDRVILSTQKARQHRYLFLTKNPERYDEWLERFEESKIQGLDEIRSCWFGASASNNEELERANRSRAMWLSIEPIRERIDTEEDQFVEFVPTPSGEYERPRWAWVVIGAETGNSKNKVKPEKEWVDAIVKECDNYGTPVFMKESLRDLMGEDFRQEFPWG